MTLNEAIKKSLYAYGMEFKMRQEAKKTERYGGLYPAQCLESARWWLQQARYWRAIASEGK